MIGTTIDQYRITERLGGGGMGDVYRATDLELDREVAIKCVRADLADIGDVTRRFRTEARTLARLSHQNIATVFRFFSQDAQLFLVMEYIAGTHFGSMLRARGPVSQQKAADLLGQALDGLGYAHAQKVVHRDIKPGNLMVDAQGTVKVLDFGIAHVLDSTRMTRTGGIVGTPAYMAPEQALGQPVDHRTDLYSLGIVLYEMLTGTLPFEANSDFELMRAHVEVTPRPLSELSPSLPPHLQYTVSRALAKDTAERFQTAGEFADALRTPSGTTTVVTPRPAVSPAQSPPAALPTAGALAARARTWFDLARERIRPNAQPLLMGAAALVLVVAGAFWMFGRDRNAMVDVTGAVATAPAPEPAPQPLAGAADALPAQSVTATTAPGASAARDATAPRDTAAATGQPSAPASTARPQSTTPSADRTTSIASLPARATPRPATLPAPSVRVRKISVHERQGTGRFSRAAGYNGDFTLTAPGGGTRSLRIDEVLEVSRDGQQVLREVVNSAEHKPGVFESKQRVPALKQLPPGSYNVRLVFEAGGRDLGHHDWKLDVVD